MSTRPLLTKSFHFLVAAKGGNVFGPLGCEAIPAIWGTANKLIGTPSIAQRGFCDPRGLIGPIDKENALP